MVANTKNVLPQSGRPTAKRMCEHIYKKNDMVKTANPDGTYTISQRSDNHSEFERQEPIIKDLLESFCLFLQQAKEHVSSELTLCFLYRTAVAEAEYVLHFLSHDKEIIYQELRDTKGIINVYEKCKNFIDVLKSQQGNWRCYEFGKMPPSFAKVSKFEYNQYVLNHKRYYKALNQKIGSMISLLEEICKMCEQSEQTEAKLEKLKKSNKIFKREIENQTVNLLAIYLFIKNKFIENIRHQYEWVALKIYLKEFLEDESDVSFAMQMMDAEWFGELNNDRKRSCTNEALGTYSALVNEPNRAKWSKEMNSISKDASKKGIKKIIDLLDMLEDTDTRQFYE